MKCKFTLEIECLDSIKNSLDGEFAEEIETAFRIGLHEKFGGWQGQNFSLKLVEQTCGTLDFAEKTIDLLDRAKRRLNECEGYCDGSNNDYLVEEIDQFIKSNTQRKYTGR